MKPNRCFEIQECIENAIRRTVEEFQGNPYDFFNEWDIHFRLWGYLCSRIPEKKRMVEGRGFCVDVVRPEYPGSPRAHYDLAVLNPDFVSVAAYERVEARRVGPSVRKEDEQKAKLLSVIETKLILSPGETTEEEILEDLGILTECHAMCKYLLVFSKKPVLNNFPNLESKFRQHQKEVRVAWYSGADNKLIQFPDAWLLPCER